MQRTIRFRGKATGKGNIPTNWVYGGGCFAVAGNTFIFADPTPKFMGNGVYEAKAIEVRFICQSTGLHDIFKSVVYEGDVVRLDGNKKYTYVIEWSGNTRLSWHVASRQRQDLQTLPHSYRLK